MTAAYYAKLGIVALHCAEFRVHRHNIAAVYAIEKAIPTVVIVRKSLSEIVFTNITEADDGETAWPLIEQALAAGAPFQLILSDWNMPKLKGIDLLRKVRATPAIAKVPFILLTAEAEKTQIIEAVKAGVTNYITKPFTADTLRKKLEVVYAAISKEAAG